MALQTRMKQGLLRIAEAIHEYVKMKGWDVDSYHLYYRADEAWNHFHIAFVAREFEGLDYYSGYRDVMNFLKDKLSDYPGLFESVGLITRDPKRLAESGIVGIGPDFEDVASEFTDGWTPYPAKS